MDPESYPEPWRKKGWCTNREGRWGLCWWSPSPGGSDQVGVRGNQSTYKQLNANSEFLTHLFSKSSLLFSSILVAHWDVGRFILSVYLLFSFALICLPAVQLSCNFQLFTKHHTPWIYISLSN